jgi:hypothetical protein
MKSFLENFLKKIKVYLKRPYEEYSKLPYHDRKKLKRLNETKWLQISPHYPNLNHL